jgi:hypothetical protein
MLHDCHWSGVGTEAQFADFDDVNVETDKGRYQSPPLSRRTPCKLSVMDKARQPADHS